MLNYTLDQLVRTTVLLTAEKNIDTLLEKILEEDDAGEVLREGYVEILPSNGLELVELAQ